MIKLIMLFDISSSIEKVKDTKENLMCLIRQRKQINTDPALPTHLPHSSDKVLSVKFFVILATSNETQH